MPRAHLTPGTVITAAANLADETAPNLVTLSAVARRLGVQTASLYNHVRDRAQLIDGVHELALDNLADRIGTAIAGRAGGDALIGYAEAHSAFARDCPGRWVALQQPAAESTVSSQGAVRVATLTLAVLRGYALPEEELVHVARMLGATINGFLALERSGGFGHRSPDPEVSWRRTLTALDAVIRSWPARQESTTPTPMRPHEEPPT